VSNTVNEGRRQSDLAKRLVDQLTDAVNARDLEAIDDLVTATYRHQAPGSPLTLDELKHLNRAFYAGFPDLRWEIERLVAEDNFAVAFWRARGTHQGTFMGRPATGRAITLAGINTYRIADGRIAEDTPHWEFSTLLNQLGSANRRSC